MCCILYKDISNKMSSKRLCFWHLHTATQTIKKKNVQSLAQFQTFSGPFYMETILQ